MERDMSPKMGPRQRRFMICAALAAIYMLAWWILR